MLTRGAMKHRLYDLLRDDAPQEAPDTRTTAEVSDSIIAGLAAILEKEGGT